MSNRYNPYESPSNAVSDGLRSRLHRRSRVLKFVVLTLMFLVGMVMLYFSMFYGWASGAGRISEVDSERLENLRDNLFLGSIGFIVTTGFLCFFWKIGRSGVA